MTTATIRKLPRHAQPIGALCAALVLMTGTAMGETGMASDGRYALPLAAASAPPPRPEHLLAAAPVAEPAPVVRSNRPAQARQAQPRATAQPPAVAERTRPPLRIDPRYRWSSGEMR